ncbi:MAG: hypothetical protein AB1Z98_38145 [Nannocystaceae bacterium]
MLRLALAIAAAAGLGSGCGPTIELESDSGSGSATSDPMDPTVGPGESADSSGGQAAACGVGDTELVGGGPPGPLGFPPGCDPRVDPGTNGYRCCSDDPAAAGNGLPAYEGRGIAGAPPYFADANNDVGRSGLCVDVSQVAGQGLQGTAAIDCPIPCNPTWGSADIATVCGPARQCCQTQELQPADCVEDPDTGRFRPVTGDDIGLLTQWGLADHATHQDPNGDGCLALAGGDVTSMAFQECARSLSVADQRGVCMQLAPGQSCPHAQSSYVDACEALNGG